MNRLTAKHPNLVFLTCLFILSLFVMSIPALTRADETAPYKNYSSASAVGSGARSVFGAQLGSWDPAVSVSLDTGFVDTAGCQAACLATIIEVETATTVSGTCTVYGGANYVNGVTTDDWSVTIGTTQVAASSKSLAASVCAGVSPATSGTSAGVGYGFSAPLPKHVRVTCANVAGVNYRATMQCH
jgi:hypothetical protein